MVDISDKEKKIRDLTPTEKQQIVYLQEEYPHLSTEIFETILRLSDNQRELIVNDIKDGNECVRTLMRLSVEYDCHIMTVIHSNYGSDKPTGHLGSFLEKKTENQIQLEINTVNKEWITVKCKRSRGYAFETFSFKVNDIGLPEIVGDLYDPLQN